MPNYTPTCPRCGFSMVKRRAKSDGHAFWGCSRYFSHRCSGYRPYLAQQAVVAQTYTPESQAQQEEKRKASIGRAAMANLVLNVFAPAGWRNFRLTGVTGVDVYDYGFCGGYVTLDCLGNYRNLVLKPSMARVSWAFSFLTPEVVTTKKLMELKQRRAMQSLADFMGQIAKLIGPRRIGTEVCYPVLVKVERTMGGYLYIRSPITMNWIAVPRDRLSPVQEYAIRQPALRKANRDKPFMMSVAELNNLKMVAVP